MNRAEFILALSKTASDEKKVEAIQQIYGKNLPSDVQKVISFDSRGTFLDGDHFCRLLSFDEISKASEELHVDFVRHCIVPLFDIGDNDFIVFDLQKSCWEKFNIVDEVSYGEKESVSEII